MQIFLVGGAVRDQLLQFPYTEKDWVVVGSTPEEMLNLGYIPVGKDFPVFLHPSTHEEYALARTERKTAPGYKGFTFHTDQHISLEEDLKRRDLTINAIAQDNHGALIDPYGGQNDIQQKVLRHVSDAFSEDPVRVLRVARFAARYHHLGFSVAEPTLALMQTMVQQGETKHLVAERVWQECQKALGEKHPDIFFNVLAKCQALDDILLGVNSPSIDNGIKALERVCQYSQDPTIRFGAFCFTLLAKNISAFCSHLRVPKDYSELALLIKHHHNICTSPKLWSKTTLSDLFQKTDALRKTQRFEQLIKACHCISGTINSASELQSLLIAALQHYRQVDHQTLIAQGYEKAALGQAIQATREQQLEDWLRQASINGLSH